MIISYGTKNLDLGNVTGITQIIKDTVYHSDTFFVYTETETYMFDLIPTSLRIWIIGDSADHLIDLNTRIELITDQFNEIYKQIKRNLK